ncbi:Release factor glutamine methyltransferase [Candidatus Providencia siddallii]|uniref:Release factor glutamine methyltransferase n=1 Tax=Candidatus Providencia siddallii TaxID=1715285 RepID=A0A0M6W8C1_9GAMM|nr:Release factor glutamine methyltransferase [Candidatus Providencia siddallii]
MNYKDWIRKAIIRLSFTKNAKQEAEILLEYITGHNQAYIFAFSENELTGFELEKLEFLLQRREKGEPIAYIIGECEFWSMPIYVTPATIIPRPDTECLVEQALLRLPKQKHRLLDLGTGTGVIALAIASESKKSFVVGVDINYEAVSLARQNQYRLNIFNVYFMQSDWFNSLLIQQFDIIVSNPPYIEEDNIHLYKGDLRFEPLSALVAKNNGLSNIEYIIKISKQYLKNQGWLILEHGWKQGLEVCNLFKMYGYINIKTCIDYSNRDRVSLAQLYI